MKMGEIFAEVVIPIPVEGSFTYRVPSPMAGTIAPGARVLVPFGSRILTAFVLDLRAEAPPVKIRDILELLDPVPLIDSQILDLCRWISSYYFCPLGLVLKTALPSGLLKKERVRLILKRRDVEAGTIPPPARTIFDLLLERSPATLDSVKRSLGRPAGDILRAAAALEKMGLVELERYIGGGRVGVRKRKMVRVKEVDEACLASLEKSSRQMECYRYLLSSGEDVALSKLRKEGGFSLSVIRGLESKGAVGIVDVEDTRVGPEGSMDIFGEGWDDLTPGRKQGEVLEEIGRAIDERERKTFLVHGVSGSGKTVVYIEAIRKVLGAGRSAILLVPEIVLTPQTVSRLRQAIDQPVALFHSALSEGERYDTWRKVRSGDYRVVVGARSAVFSPLENLGLIVIDEEHEMSYKQEESPRYHAREVALERAEKTGSVVILGSATPSLESYWKVRRGAYCYVEMPRRYRSRPVPRISIVDMRKEKRWRGSWFISEALGEKLLARQQRGEQSILFLNRRGHSTFLQCLLCGWVAKCRQCDISVTYHRANNSLTCHYCNEKERLPDCCPSCQGDRLRLRGLGTEQVEEEVRNSLPGIRIARMDLDSTGTKGAHQRILEGLLRGETDVLLGTQMVTKGLDFPGITLVGVISSDVSLHFPDLRSAERTFQLLAQVAGRSGREGGGGEVVLQTFIPDSGVLQAASRLDYAGFVAEELRERSETAYPPFYNLTNVTAVGGRRERVIEVINRAAAILGKSIRDGAGENAAFVVGPAPGVVERIRGEYRWHLIFKAREDIDPAPYLREMKERMKGTAMGDVQLHLDRDPVSFV